ncbi:MAG TPA: undecaprenyldiphospho-muramoylpentapeptide beta-N-acetylglucosaminyltransferase [Bdellovibrionales bacterium]|jgi:UDP-N-acetylglucosamine--N-acetylmuramyl-(pentapeptide) pyrophosphoryl-undecaprenol N-acetylglucosamine transferase|nr:undecaprenyldiphospho-muramoylpentapeptide beta-N-acetylglucosaminyltransferase [Bdellovibrionales bacterium]
MSNRNVIIAGGGTGGHIYPGVAIARAVEKSHPDLKVHFVGATGGLEEKIVPREGFPLHLIPIGKLHHSVGLLTRVKTVLKMPFAFLKAVKTLRDLNPVAVLGVGGFASGPILFAASVLGYRSLIWEPNAHPGLANRLLAGRVDECLLVFDEAEKHLHAKKVTKSGLPVRAAMVPVPRDTSSTRPLRVLIFGGSQGARFINNLMPQVFKEGGSWMAGIEVVHQTGPHDFANVKNAYQGAPASFEIHEYLHDMDQRYAWADVVVCRSGASTVAEIGACQKAAIFIPLPTAADDHQRKNAEVLARADAALLFTQSELTPEKLRESLKNFRDDRSRIAKFENNVRQFQFPNAAEKIVERLLERT